METAFRGERLRNADWSHVVRGRGNTDAICQELRVLDRHRSHQCGQDQQSASFCRTQGYSPGFSRQRPPYQEGFNPNKQEGSPRGFAESLGTTWQRAGEESPITGDGCAPPRLKRILRISRFRLSGIRGPLVELLTDLFAFSITKIRFETHRCAR